MKNILILFGCMVICLHSTQARSTGAPISACTTITPGHGGSSQEIPGGFYIYSDLIDDGGNYESNTQYTIKLESEDQTNFKGFLIQARMSGSSTPIGAFSGLPAGTKHVSCSGVEDATVTHTSSDFKTSVTFVWNSPSNSGTVQFQYAVVKGFNDYFADIDASTHRPISMTTSSSSTTSSTTTTDTATTTTDATSTTDDTTTTTTTTDTATTTTEATSTTDDTTTTTTTTDTATTTTEATTTTDDTTATTTTEATTTTDDTTATTTTEATSTTDDTTATTTTEATTTTDDTTATTTTEATTTTDDTTATTTTEATTTTDDATATTTTEATSPTDTSATTTTEITSTTDTSTATTSIEATSATDTSATTTTDDTSATTTTDDTSATTTTEATTATTDTTTTYTSAITNTEATSTTDTTATTTTEATSTTDTSATTTTDDTTATTTTDTTTSSSTSTTIVPTASSTTTSTHKVTSTSSTSSTTNVPTSTPSISCPNTNKSSDTEFGITFRKPDGCERKNCTLYWAMGPNNENSMYLDIYMEGDIAGGWMALGFSKNQLMPSTDVLTCHIVSGIVKVTDTWNPANSRSNVADDTQEGVCVHMTEYNDAKRLKCLFSRYGVDFDPKKDVKLDDSLYIIRGYRNSTSSSSTNGLLEYHTETPIVTNVTYNPLRHGIVIIPPGSSGICPTGAYEVILLILMITILLI